MIPMTWYSNGFTELVSVIPPNATLSPNSKVKAESRGKSPGVKYSNGTWGGYDWLNAETTESDVEKMAATGANVGLRADRFPAVDIDVLDPSLSNILAQHTTKALGLAPKRVGRAPKALLMYRLKVGSEPFGRMALKISDGKHEHLLEVLCAGRQYLVHGTHPSGAAYEWDRDMGTVTPEALSAIDREDVLALFAELEDLLPVLGYEVTRIGTGKVAKPGDVDQQELRAPSLEALAEAVGCIPNTNELFPSREDYIKVGYAIRAAGGDEAEQIFLDWAMSWEGNGKNPRGNDPATVESDWRRIGPPFHIGWSWLAQLARQHGFNDAAYEFDATGEPAPVVEEPKPLASSDHGLALQVVEEHGNFIRYDRTGGRWMVWDGTRWAPDALGAAEHRVSQTMRRLADEILRRGGSPKEIAQALGEAKRLGSATLRDNVIKLLKAEPGIAAVPEQFDHDGWLLNTPGGTVNLETGDIAPPNPAAMLTKMTKVAPAFGTPCPIWKRFLSEATNGDPELEAFLQRVAGYALTGSTKEQVFFFIWGPGGNGKSVFLNALTQILGDYSRQAPMDMFAASHGDRHPTDLAGLQGARLVAASETQAGRRWDEAKMKALTGGDPISARFMRGDYFQYHPHFKLVFVGNHKPQIRDIDAAMRRRVVLVPFTVTPQTVDRELSRKLEAEYPAILAWMLEGCIKWQRDGLKYAEVVKDATEEYFEDEDAIGRWLKECTEPGSSEDFTPVAELYQRWREWANANGEWDGSQRRLTQALVQKGYHRDRSSDAGSRTRGFRGLKLRKEGVEWS